MQRSPMRNESSQPHSPTPGLPALGSSGRKRSPIIFVYKNQQGLRLEEMEGFCIPRPFLLNSPPHTNLASFALSSSIVATAWKAPGIYREELNCLASGQSWEGQFFPHTKVLTEAIVPFMSPSSTELAGGHHIWVSIKLANTVLTPPLVLPWDLTSHNFQVHWSHFQWLFHVNVLSWFLIFLNSLKQGAFSLDVQPVHQVDNLRPHWSTTKPPPEATHSRGTFSKHQSSTEVSPLHSWSSTMVSANPWSW